MANENPDDGGTQCRNKRAREHKQFFVFLGFVVFMGLSPV